VVERLGRLGVQVAADGRVVDRHDPVPRQAGPLGEVVGHARRDRHDRVSHQVLAAEQRRQEAPLPLRRAAAGRAGRRVALGDHHPGRHPPGEAPGRDRQQVLEREGGNQGRRALVAQVADQGRQHAVGAGRPPRQEHRQQQRCEPDRVRPQRLQPPLPAGHAVERHEAHARGHRGQQRALDPAQQEVDRDTPLEQAAGQRQGRPLDTAAGEVGEEEREPDRARASRRQRLPDVLFRRRRQGSSPNKASR
jgi:hypothetical protein